MCLIFFTDNFIKSMEKQLLLNKLKKKKNHTQLKKASKLTKMIILVILHWNWGRKKQEPSYLLCDVSSFTFWISVVCVVCVQPKRHCSHSGWCNNANIHHVLNKRLNIHRFDHPSEGTFCLTAPCHHVQRSQCAFRTSNSPVVC